MSAICTHHHEHDAWTEDWYCRHCGIQWGDALIAYFRDKGSEGGDPRYTTQVADFLEQSKGKSETDPAA